MPISKLLYRSRRGLLSTHVVVFDIGRYSIDQIPTAVDYWKKIERRLCSENIKSRYLLYQNDLCFFGREEKKTRPT
jgi:hypothetical protein